MDRGADESGELMQVLDQLEYCEMNVQRREGSQTVLARAISETGKGPREHQCALSIIQHLRKLILPSKRAAGDI